MFGFSSLQIMLLLLLGVMLFGKRLPEVAGMVGKTLMQFKNSLRGVEDEVTGSFRRMMDEPTSPPPAKTVRPPQRIAPTAPKFVDPPEPV